MLFTTDSFVVNPLFFKGGNIGKLVVCGTVNDLAVSGAKSLYLTCAFINTLVDCMLEVYNGIHVIRDATRGGVAAFLNEICDFSKVTIAIEEQLLPIKEEVKGAAEMLGF